MRPARRMGLPADLEAARALIEANARAAGLDFFDVAFELCDHEEMNMLAAQGGFPVRYPHWRWGMEFLRMQKGHEHGLHKVYELVLNTDPAWAYLLESNAPVDQKLVMAHVYAHADFFKNNAWYAGTNRRMLDRMADHATKVRRIIDQQGAFEVERWLDVALSLDNLVNLHGAYRPQGAARPHEADSDGRFPAQGYMEGWINPPEALAEAQTRTEARRSAPRRFPTTPERDVLGFVIAHGRLLPWQAELLAIVHEEAHYYLPQARTKIMNEGWASFWHTHLMTGLAGAAPLLGDAEVVDYADHHAGAVAPSSQRVNPYRLGLAMFRDIVRRHGLRRAFEVRRTHNDLTFLDSFLTAEVCAEAGLYAWTVDRRTGARVVEGREVEDLREKLLGELTNLGQPLVEVTDADAAGRGELALLHHHEGVDLQLDHATEVLANLARAWGRPVSLHTRVDGREAVLHHDGTTLRADGVKMPSVEPTSPRARERP